MNFVKPDYNCKQSFLDISNYSINGILCLKNFTELIELDCSYNQITLIQIFSKSLKKLIVLSIKLLN